VSADKFSRRRLLQLALRLPLFAAAAPLITACSRSGTNCADPDLLTTSEIQLRKTLEYVELAPDRPENCVNCEFFTSETDTASGCGHCELFNGAVSAGGYCTSWANS